jgi:hypothetical protein
MDIESAGLIRWNRAKGGQDGENQCRRSQAVQHGTTGRNGIGFCLKIGVTQTAVEQSGLRIGLWQDRNRNESCESQGRET